RSRRAADELRRIDRMKNEFVAMVAHDITSPLSVVGGFVEVLLTQWDGTSDADKRQILERVARTAGDLAGLVGDILAVARIEAGELEVVAEPFDLVSVATRAAMESTP